MLAATRVSFLVPDIGAPIVGAAVRMAEALRAVDFAEYEIVGPDLGRGINSMYRAEPSIIPVSCPRLYRLPDYWWKRRKIERATTGNILVAMKAFRNTVLLALEMKSKRGAKAVVFLDEWDGAGMSNQSRFEQMRLRMREIFHPLNGAHFPAVERMIPRADLVLSTTTFLQKKFGGHVIAMGVDAHRFKPQPAEAVEALRAALGLKGKKLIVFGGVVRPHKGIEIIPEALDRISDDSIRLLIVGPRTSHVEAMMGDPRLGRWIVLAGAPMDDPDGVNAAIHKSMPLYLDLADLVVLPLLNTPLAQSQMPIKIFEALAMAKPVIASAVSDLPQVVDGCGLIVPPGDVDALARAISSLLSNDELRLRLGLAAREKSLREYDLPIVGRRLKSLLLDD